MSAVPKTPRPAPARRAVARTAPAPEVEDHRVRTGALRRERMRRKLLSAAMRVFAEMGIDAPLIDDFIAAAGVARGTFYNYFDTTQELLDAVTSELSDAILHNIDKVVVTIDDPLQRLATGCLLYLHIGVDFPSWGAFVMRTGFRSHSIGKLVDVYLTRDLELARKAGELEYPSLRAARDLVLSSIAQAIVTVIDGDAPRAHLRQMLALALHGIGATVSRARKVSQLPLPPLQLPELQWDGNAS
ncbi:MAG: TetR/AcrR family transcriptional regulator [Pseudorhodoferax sp.]